MPVHYDISPELQIILLVCTGLVSGPEIFGAADLIRADDRFHYGMVVLIDLFSARDNFELKDILVAIQRMKDTADKGYKRAKIVLLSMSTGIQLLVDSMH